MDFGISKNIWSIFTTEAAAVIGKICMRDVAKFLQYKL